MNMKISDLVTNNVWLLDRFELGRMARLEVAAQGPVQTRAPGARKANGAAIVDVFGMIAPRNSWLLSLLGGTSIEQILANFNAALADSSVDRIVLNIDSPGGSVAGVSDLASWIYSARAKKPVLAFTSGCAASAAYWIAAAASTIVTSDTAALGSIGVLAVVPDDRGRQTRDGVVFHEIISSGAPHKRPDPATDAGRAVLQANVDALEEIFVASVARFRGVSSDRVLTDFGRGGVLIGENAVHAGLADIVGTLDDTLRGIQIKQRAPAAVGGDPRSEWNSSPALRAEFGRIEAYVGYLKHQELVAARDGHA